MHQLYHLPLAPASGQASAIIYSYSSTNPESITEEQPRGTKRKGTFAPSLTTFFSTCSRLGIDDNLQDSTHKSTATKQNTGFSRVMTSSAGRITRFLTSRVSSRVGSGGVNRCFDILTARVRSSWHYSAYGRFWLIHYVPIYFTGTTAGNRHC